MHPAHAVIGKLHEHPKNTTEGPSPLRRDRSGSRRLGRSLPLAVVWELTTASCTPALCGAVPQGEPALLPAPGAPWFQGCCGCHVMGYYLQEQPGVKEKT